MLISGFDNLDYIWFLATASHVQQETSSDLVMPPRREVGALRAQLHSGRTKCARQKARLVSGGENDSDLR